MSAQATELVLASSLPLENPGFPRSPSTYRSDGCGEHSTYITSTCGSDRTGKGFRDFIYAQVGYNPSGEASVAWQRFHDRVTLAYHTVPHGYFSIFKELADIFVMLIRKGANLGPTFLPDVSVGQLWSKFWITENLEVLHGERIKYEHNYPTYFPQAASNPQHHTPTMRLASSQMGA